MSKPQFEDYDFAIRRVKAEDGGGYTITFPDLPGCRSDGETVSEAEENGRDAFNTWIEACLADGRAIPRPGERDESPAKFLQRVPRYVHSQLLEAARHQGVSVNGLVTGFIIAGLERIQASQAAGSITNAAAEPHVATHPASAVIILDEMKASIANSSSALMRWDDRTDVVAFPAGRVAQRRRAHG